jgi:hypothetical protein
MHYTFIHGNRTYKIFDIYFSVVRILQVSWDTWSLGAVTVGLADWKSPRIVIFKCSFAVEK